VSRDVRKKYEEGLKGAGVLVRSSFEFKSFSGIAVRLSEKELEERLKEDQFLSAVAEDRIYRVNRASQQCTDEQTSEWNLKRVSTIKYNAGATYNYPSTSGADVHAYVIDTGIYIQHNEFRPNRARWGYTFDYDEDCNGHGTHVAGTIGGTLYGLAKNVKLVAVKVLDCDGSGYMTDILDGIAFVGKDCPKGSNKKCNANMSLGGSLYKALNDAIDELVTEHNIPVIVAAGNSDANACNYSPASAERAITVGATQLSGDDRSSFSNWGDCVDIFAPGSAIKSAWIGGVNAVNTISGTSMASPHVAGRVSIYQRTNPTESAEQIKSAIVAQASKDLINLKCTKSGCSESPNLMLHQSCA